MIRFKREAPLLFGLLAAWVVLGNAGWLFYTSQGPTGTSWFHYREAAHLMMHSEDQCCSWPMWRLNLYPWLLGYMGEHWGFDEAAAWISSVATL